MHSKVKQVSFTVEWVDSGRLFSGRVCILKMFCKASSYFYIIFLDSYNAGLGARAIYIWANLQVGMVQYIPL